MPRNILGRFFDFPFEAEAAGLLLEQPAAGSNAEPPHALGAPDRLLGQALRRGDGACEMRDSNPEASRKTLDKSKRNITTLVCPKDLGSCSFESLTSS